MTEAIKKAIWLKELVAKLEGVSVGATVWSDSQSAVYLSKNQTHHERTKHIDIWLHFICDIIAQGAVKVKVATEDNLADMMTKVLPGTKFRHCLNLVNARDIDEPQ